MTENELITNEIIREVVSNRISAREALKQRVQEEIDKNRINYADAISIFEASGLFDIDDCIIYKGPWVIEYYDDYCSDLIEKYQTIHFTDIIDWIYNDEGELQEAYDAAGLNEPYNPIKDLYEFAKESNLIGYNFDW